MKLKYGDIILFKPTGLIGKLIAFFDGSKYSHGAIFWKYEKGIPLFIESHEKKNGVNIQQLHSWGNYIVLRPLNSEFMKPIKQVKLLDTLGRKYDYGRLIMILKSKISRMNVSNNDPYKLICTELCDYCYNYMLGQGDVCTPNTIYRLYQKGTLIKIK